MESSNCVLPFLDKLNPDQINRLNENSFLIKLKKHEILFSQDKPVSHLMYMNSGLVKIFKENDRQKSVITEIIGPGNFIGLFTSFYGRLYQYSAETIEDSELIYVDLPAFYKILHENGSTALYFINQLSKEGLKLNNQLVNFPDRQIPGRIAGILLFFATQIYHNDQFVLPLSRQELAELAYTTKESVSRTLTEFRNDKMIDLDDRRISIMSIELIKVLSKLG